MVLVRRKSPPFIGDRAKPMTAHCRAQPVPVMQYIGRQLSRSIRALLLARLQRCASHVHLLAISERPAHRLGSKITIDDPQRHFNHLQFWRARSRRKRRTAEHPQREPLPSQRRVHCEQALSLTGHRPAFALGQSRWKNSLAPNRWEQRATREPPSQQAWHPVFVEQSWHGITFSRKHHHKRDPAQNKPVQAYT